MEIDEHLKYTLYVRPQGLSIDPRLVTLVLTRFCDAAFNSTLARGLASRWFLDVSFLPCRFPRS